MSELHDLCGDIDIYLFDQLLHERIVPGMTICDAGCGDGRNLVYLLRRGYEVYAVDQSPEAIRAVRALAARLAPRLSPENFRVEPVEALSFPAASADVVIGCAVLHFARDEAHFAAMLKSMWRLLRPGGMLFCRLASAIGLEDRVQRIEGRRFQLPDGTQRFLVDESMLLQATADLGGRLVDPIKTTNVQNQRCMTTWVVRRER